MSEHDERLQALLRACRGRITLLVIERLACWGAVITGLLALVLVLLDLLTAWYVTPTVLWILFLLGVISGIVYARLRPISELAIALTVERRLNLKQRLSTAVVLDSDEESDPEIRELVKADAIATTMALQPNRIFPRQLRRHHKAALATWGGVVLLFLLPSIPWLHSPEEIADRENMRQAGKALKHVAQQMQRRKEVSQDKTARQIAANMRKLGIEMEKNRLPKKHALVKMNKLEQQLDKLERELQRKEEQQAKEQLKNAEKAVQQALSSRSAGQKAAAERAKQKIAAGKKESELSKEEREALKQEQQLQKLAKQLQSGNTQGASQTMQQLQKSGPSLPLSNKQLNNIKNALNPSRLPSVTIGRTNQQQIQQAMQQVQQAHQNMAQGNQGQNGQNSNQGQNGQNGQNGQSGRNGQNGQGQNGQNGQGQNGSNGQNGQNGQGNNRTGTPNGPRGNGSGAPGGGGPSSGNLGSRPHSRLRANSNMRYDPSAMNEQGQAYSIDIMGEPGQSDRTNVPYYEVYPEYRTQAEHAVNSENVPPTERERVKRYFDALNPNGE